MELDHLTEVCPEISHTVVPGIEVKFVLNVFFL
jgi:hypothetical protein